MEFEQQSGNSLESYLNDEKGRSRRNGENFKYTSIEVTSCGDSSEDQGITDIIDMLNGVYEDYGASSKFEDTLKDAKFIMADLTVTVGDEEYLYTDKLIYIYLTAEIIYIFYNTERSRNL